MPLIESVDVTVYTVPTPEPESDGTLTWTATTVVVVEPRAGGVTGLGFSYATGACARLIDDVLGTAVIGLDALDAARSWSAIAPNDDPDPDHARTPEVDGDGSVAEVDGRARYLGTWELTLRALHDPKHAAVRWNLDFFLKLRHLIEHRYLPAVDVAVVGEAQAMLLNYKNVLVAWFGEEAQLGSELVVPLQLSQLRGDHRLSSQKRFQAELPVDVTEFLTRHRSDVPVAAPRTLDGRRRGGASHVGGAEPLSGRTPLAVGGADIGTAVRAATRRRQSNSDNDMGP